MRAGGAVAAGCWPLTTVRLSARLEVHLVGGFKDERQLSQKLTHQLLSKFTVFFSPKLDEDFYLFLL